MASWPAAVVSPALLRLARDESLTTEGRTENLYPDHHRRGVVTGPFFLRSEVIAIGALLKDQAELDKDSDSGWQTPDDDLPEVDLTTESGIMESRLRNIRPNMATFCREERRLLMLVVEVSSMTLSSLRDSTDAMTMSRIQRT